MAFLPVHQSSKPPQQPYYNRIAQVIVCTALKDYVRAKVGSESRKIQAQSYYFRPGVTFGRRIRRFAPAALPSNCIFSDSSNAIFVSHDSRDRLAVLLGALNGELAGRLLSLYAPLRKMEVGFLQRLPFPELASQEIDSQQELADAAVRAFRLKRQMVAYDETDSHFNCSPPKVSSLAEDSALRDRCNTVRLSETEAIQSKLNQILLDAYRFEDGGHADVMTLLPLPTAAEADAEEQDENNLECATFRSDASDWLSFGLGCAIGRWDVRFVTGEKSPPELPDLFDPLPACSPGMLQGPDGLPAKPEDVPDDYLIDIDWDGIFVDDPEHQDDIVRRVREAFAVIWKGRAEAIEKEACEILGVRTLRDYFRKPGKGGFWEDHVKRYSKSRRKAPIYWLLQSSKKNYALWIYYHRLDKDMLFKALLNYVEPKIRLEENRLASLRTQKAAAGDSSKEIKKIDKEIEKQDDLLSDLRDFEDKLRRAANLHLAPDLNDGVVLNIAPLHELVPWKEAKKYWNELLDGKYEWSTIGKQLREKGLVA